MRRRLILVAAILAVVGGVVMGVWYYRRQGSAQKMLARIRVETTASHFDNARKLADEYVSKYPDDWRGYYAQAEVCMAMGRYEDARGPLQKLLGTPALGADPLVITLYLADSYALDASRKADAPTASQATLRDAITEIGKANDLLAALNVQPTSAADGKALDVLASIGLNQAEIGFARLKLAELIAQDAEIARAGGAAEAVEANMKESREDRQLGDQARAEATKTLLRVVSLDPTRARAAQSLVQLCMERRDEESMNAVREVMAKAAKPPPMAELMLLRHDVDISADRDDADTHRKKLQDVCNRLDAILARGGLTPQDAMQIKLARAEMALGLGDCATVSRVIDEDILKANSRVPEARLIKARMLITQNKHEDAERLLLGLKTDYPRSIKIQYWHAKEALAVGMTDTALTTLQNLLDGAKANPPMDSGDLMCLALAWRYTVNSLIRTGLYERAFLQAKEYHRAFPADPAAIRLMVRAAAGMLQNVPASEAKPLLDRAVLDLAVDRAPSSAAMLMAVSEGYMVLGDPSAAASVARRAASSECLTVEDRRSKAVAMWNLGNRQQAEDYLAAELARDPSQAELHIALGYFCSQTGRGLQAIDQFRAALAIDPSNEEFAFVLARELFGAGETEQAYHVLEAISAPGIEVQRLMAAIQARRGEAPPAESLALETGTRSVMFVAREYLRSGQVQQAIEICNRELQDKKSPNIREAHAILARANQVLGQWSDAADHWAKVIELDPTGAGDPDPQATYQALAMALLRQYPLEQVPGHIAQVPRAQKELVALTEGWLYMQARSFAKAADAFGRLADDASARPEYRDEARYKRVEALASAGRIQEALDDVDTLQQQGLSWQMVGLTRVGVLAMARRDSEAGTILDGLCERAAAEGDVNTLTKAARLYLQLGMPEQAISTCERIVKLRPQDAGSYLFRATIVESAGKGEQTLDDYRKAVELQGQNLDIRRRLVAALDRAGQPRAALEAAKAMEQLGHIGWADSMLARGELFAGWGLQQQAVEALGPLQADPSYADVPKAQFLLGRALATIGRKREAADVLAKVPPFADPFYLPARKLLVLLVDTPEEKLEILHTAAATKGLSVDLLLTEMGVLLAAGRPAEAVQVFRQQADKLGPNLPMMRELNYLAIYAMLRSGDVESASGWCERLAGDGGNVLWRRLAVLLCPEQQLDRAKALLPQPAEADLASAMLGVAVAAQSGDTDGAARWGKRVKELADALAKARPQEPPRARLVLAALASGQKDLLAEQLARCESLPPVMRSAIKSLVESMRAKPDPAVAAKLLKATMAVEVLPDLRNQWAIEVLRDDPSNEFAAALVSDPARQPTVEACRQARELLTPTDSLVGLLLAASVQMYDKEYAKAAESYQALVQATGGDTNFLYMQAEALQSAGEAAKALEIYRRVYKANGSPLAANNAAYVITELWPTDRQKLTDAKAMIEPVVAAAPHEISFRDTLGWVAYLMGDNDQALSDLRQAVKGLPDSPEVHYHLGMAEAAGGDEELARWHLAAAVYLGRQPAEEGQELTPAAKQAAQHAAEALERMPATRPAK